VFLCNLCNDNGMKQGIATEKLHTLCNDSANCNCPIITGDKACSIVTLINEFVSETNPIRFEMSDKDYTDFVLYVALASLRG
jgi:hypothetical protein